MFGNQNNTQKTKTNLHLRVSNMRQLEIAVEFNMFFLLFFILGKDPLISTAAVATTATYCEYYNRTMCPDATKPCSGKEECEVPTDGKRNHCYVVWNYDEKKELIITLKGCFLNNEQCYNKDKCVNRQLGSKIKFCCCEGSMCNQNFTWEPAPTTLPPILSHEPIPEALMSSSMILICSFIVSLAVITTAALLYWCYRRHKSMFNEIPTMEPHPLPPPSPYLGSFPIQLIEIKATGRFGAVWKAQCRNEEVAVKIFPVQDKQSWLTEQEIYKLSLMQHPNILHYIGVEKHTENFQTTFWLISSYHERGSLCDFLKAHTLTWPELRRVVESMTKGLMHLHEEIPGKNGLKGKPSIAHRDFKSKNVLIKKDMTVCIADFGLALVFEPGKSCGDTHGQVGTRRYMAPEVLEGAINFTQDSFLRIDMYACGLVLWELVSRCTAIEGRVPDYRLPFEEEVGQHPTLEDMQESVVQRKVRPAIPQTWRNHLGLSAICDTMEECWDHDAEARLSASCIMERVVLQGQYLCPVGWRIENDSLIGEMKESSM